MDRKTWSIFLAVAFIASFFLDWGGGASAFDIVKSSYGNALKYLYLVFPIAGVMLLIGALQNGNYPGGYSLWTWLPFLTVLFMLIIKPLIDGYSFNLVLKSLGKGYGIGAWIAIAASVLAAFYQPRGK